MTHPLRPLRSALPLLLALAAPLAGQSVKVSGPLALSPGAEGGDVDLVRSTPDGTRVLYLADQDTSGIVELYSVPADGSGSAVRISDIGQISPFEDVEHFRVSPDSTHVVFGNYLLFTAPVDGTGTAVQLANSASGYRITADSTRVVFHDSALGIRVAAIDGSGTTTTLVPEPPFPQELNTFDISPDDGRLVYAFVDCQVPQTCDGPIVLYSIPLDGSAAAVQLSAPGDSLGSRFFSLVSFRISPDSSRVVYQAFSGSWATQLFSVPIDGSAVRVALSTALGPTGSVTDFDIDPTSQVVVHALYQDSSTQVKELYSAPIDGSAPAVQLNGTLVSGGSLEGYNSLLAPFQITPDGVRVVYRADQLTNGVFELFQVPIGGGTATRISRPLVAGGSVREFTVSPDSIGVLYMANGDTTASVELYGAAYGGGSLKYNDPFVPFSGVLDFQITPDDARVVYRGNGDDGAWELFSVPITGGTNTKLNGTLVAGGNVGVSYAPRWTITADSSRVAYIADQDVDEVSELFGVPIAGGTAIQLAPELDPGPPTGDVLHFDATADSSAVLYVADGETDDVTEIYRTSATASTPTLLSVAANPAGGISQWMWPSLTTGGARLVYLRDPDTDTRNEDELYSVRVDGSQPPVKLSQTLAGIGQPGLHYVEDFEVTPDGSGVAYLAIFNGGGGHLFTVNVDGSSPAPVKLNGAGQNLDIDNDHSEFGISPDGSRVVYRAGKDLYSAPFDGSQPAVKLTNVVGAGSVGAIEIFLPGFAISPDSLHVVYVADSATFGLHELFSVPIDGSAAPRRLSTSFPPGGDILEFGITADSLRVVYYGDQDVDERFELYSVPIRGVRMVRRDRGVEKPTRIKLNGPVVGEGVLDGCCGDGNFVLSPDGSLVAFVATPVNPNQSHLFVAAVDGSTGPLQLSPGHSLMGSKRFSPDGERVLYHATTGLFSVRADGSESPVQLSGPVGFYAISADSKWAVYQSDEQTPDVLELFARPIDGSLGPIKLSAPQVGGDVGGNYGDSPNPPFRITDDSAFVLYVADHDIDSVMELYSTPLPALP